MREHHDARASACRCPAKQHIRLRYRRFSPRGTSIDNGLFPDEGVGRPGESVRR
ncbi:hypothetical protein ACFPRL_00605 [Pseudoclavibacter helvolus]